MHAVSFSTVKLRAGSREVSASRIATELVGADHRGQNPGNSEVLYTSAPIIVLLYIALVTSSTPREYKV